MVLSRSRQFYIGLLIALILLGGIMDRLGYMVPFRTVVLTVLSPIQQLMSSTARDLTYLTEQRQSIQELQARNAELESLVNQMMIDNVRVEELRRENETLRQLLNYTRSNPQFAYEPTSIVGRSIGADPTNLLYYIYVNVGTRMGVTNNMPVITDRGLVGRVTSVGPNSAQVLLLIDAASAVNAVVQNSQATGIVRGNIDGTLLMDRISQNDRVNPGDIVLTSGLGGNFPPKLVIGQVIQVTQHDQDMFQTARIRPTVDFGKLETMLILTSFEPVDFEAEIRQSQEANN